MQLLPAGFARGHAANAAAAAEEAVAPDTDAANAATNEALRSIVSNMKADPAAAGGGAPHTSSGLWTHHIR